MQAAKSKAAVAGFTLIELVVGMLVMSIALVMLATMLFPQADRSVQTLQRVQSAELGQSILNEIWGKRYDQNTNPNGGIPPCYPKNMAIPADSTAKQCSIKLGPDDGESRNHYNDIDDYNGLDINSKMLNSDKTYASLYPEFGLNVNVSYVNPNTQAQKLIQVIVTTPAGEAIEYDAVRSNF